MAEVIDVTADSSGLHTILVFAFGFAILLSPLWMIGGLIVVNRFSHRVRRPSRNRVRRQVKKRMSAISQHENEKNFRVSQIDLDQIAFEPEACETVYGETMQRITSQVERWQAENGQPHRYKSTRNETSKNSIARRVKWSFPGLLGCWALGIVAMVIFDENPAVQVGAFVFMLASFVVFFLGLLKGFTKYTQLGFPTAEEVLSVDARSPVLYLRSFADEEMRIQTRDFSPDVITAMNWFKGLLSSIGLVKLMVNLEENIADRLTCIGPLIAIGDPRDNEINLGASRGYFDDSEWQSAILNWMEQSTFIVMVAGTSKGVLWELEKILESGYDNKLLVLFPPYPRKSPILGFRAFSAARKARSIVLEFFGMDPKVIQCKQLIGLHRKGDDEVILVFASNHFEREYELTVTLAMHPNLVPRDSTDQGILMR